jgi:hypothetical protein
MLLLPPWTNVSVSKKAWMLPSAFFFSQAVVLIPTVSPNIPSVDMELMILISLILCIFVPLYD